MRILFVVRISNMKQGPRKGLYIYLVLIILSVCKAYISVHLERKNT